MALRPLSVFGTELVYCEACVKCGDASGGPLITRAVACPSDFLGAGKGTFAISQNEANLCQEI